MRKAQAEERAQWKAEAAEAKAAERSARAITRTVSTRKDSKRKMLARAEEMIEALPPTPTPRKPRREARARRRPRTNRKPATRK